ncbi:uncharacterized protein LOC142560144 isoform X3 [Dermacentor variabilis]|uniref:uncharacterized protein LOC142560144 isoform X3 n=1 Tax=Dermacentor variabilis TaxID=34621 RepID=UPI003F5C7602
MSGIPLCGKRSFAEMNASAYACTPCGKTFTGPEPYNQHIASEKHKKKIQSGPVFLSSLVCEPCQMSFTGPAPMRDHMASPSHAKAMAKHQVTCSVRYAKSQVFHAPRMPLTTTSRTSTGTASKLWS